MADTDRLRLDDQLCFALYAATNAIVRSYRPLLAQLGLTYPQYLSLMILWETDDVSTSTIAHRLRLPVHGVIPILHRLQETGLVQRRRDPADGRVVRVSLTPAGAALESRAAAAQNEVVCRTGLSDVDLSSLRDRLEELTSVLSGV